MKKNEVHHLSIIPRLLKHVLDCNHIVVRFMKWTHFLYYALYKEMAQQSNTWTDAETQTRKKWRPLFFAISFQLALNHIRDSAGIFVPDYTFSCTFDAVNHLNAFRPTWSGHVCPKHLQIHHDATQKWRNYLWFILIVALVGFHAFNVQSFRRWWLQMKHVLKSLTDSARSTNTVGRSLLQASTFPSPSLLTISCIS